MSKRPNNGTLNLCRQKWRLLGGCEMKRFTWWRMEQDGHHLSHALCGAFCSILHHVKRFMSQPPYCFFFSKKKSRKSGKSRKNSKKKKRRKSCWTSKLRFASSIVIISKRRSETPVSITKRAKWQFLTRNGWTPKRRPLCKGQLCRCHHLVLQYVRIQVNQSVLLPPFHLTCPIIVHRCTGNTISRKDSLHHNNS